MIYLWLSSISLCGLINKIPFKSSQSLELFDLTFMLDIYLNYSKQNAQINPTKPPQLVLFRNWNRSPSVPTKIKCVDMFPFNRRLSFITQLYSQPWKMAIWTRHAPYSSRPMSMWTGKPPPRIGQGARGRFYIYPRATHTQRIRYGFRFHFGLRIWSLGQFWVEMWVCVCVCGTINFIWPFIHYLLLYMFRIGPVWTAMDCRRWTLRCLATIGQWRKCCCNTALSRERSVSAVTK